jgi:hypothetical protein
VSWATGLTLFFQAVVLVAGFLRDRRAAGIATEQALKEIKDAFDKRIDAAAHARQPYDPGVLHDGTDPTVYRD